MVNNHLGEVRELDGAWVWMDGVVPQPWTHDGVFYHAQYALTRSQFQRLVQGPGPAIGGRLGKARAGGRSPHVYRTMGDGQCGSWRLGPQVSGRWLIFCFTLSHRVVWTVD